MIEHPDLLLQQAQAKAIHRGGTQAADSAAMDAYWRALEEGKTAEEAETVFSDTYKNSLCASKETHAGS